MRIAFLGAEGVPYPAAFAKITEEVGRRLAERGHEVTVYCRSRMVSDKGSYLGMRRIRIPSLDTKHLDTLSFVLLSALDLIGRRRADVAHFHGIGPAPLAVLPRAAGIKTVAQVHGQDWQRAKWGSFAKRYIRLGERAAVRWTDAPVAVSRGLKTYLEGLYQRPVHYIPQGVEHIPAFPPEEILALGLKPKGYVLFMGRLVPEKGCHYLLDAYRKLPSGVPLVVAGGSAHTDEYAQQLRNKAAGDVRFLGHVDGRLKYELLTNALLFVQPSEMEGLSLGLLEAMSAGACILVSDIPENLEAVDGHAFIFRSGDSDDLREKMSALLADPAEAVASGERAQNFVREVYDWDTVAKAFEALYEGLLTSATLRSREEGRQR